jgi:hypothetical protein
LSPYATAAVRFEGIFGASVKKRLIFENLLAMLPEDAVAGVESWLRSSAGGPIVATLYSPCCRKGERKGNATRTGQSMLHKIERISLA